MNNKKQNKKRKWVIRILIAVVLIALIALAEYDIRIHEPDNSLLEQRLQSGELDIMDNEYVENWKPNNSVALAIIGYIFMFLLVLSGMSFYACITIIPTFFVVYLLVELE